MSVPKENLLLLQAQRKANLDMYGYEELDWEISDRVAEEINNVLDDSQWACLPAFAQYWLIEHTDDDKGDDVEKNNNDGQPNPSGSASQQASMGDSKPSLDGEGFESSRRALVEDTE